MPFSGNDQPKVYLRKVLTKEQLADVGARMRGWCSRSEHCSSEVLQRLHTAGASTEQAEGLLLALTTEGYVDDKRYAEAFVSGHFRIKRWGRIKIRQALRMKGISDGMIDRALHSEIDGNEYRRALEAVIEKKMPVEDLPYADRRKIKSKIAAFAYRRGFEADLTAAVIEELFSGARDQ